jgi:Fe-S cluster biogenesis protein NfuA
MTGDIPDLEALRESLRADGADLELVRIDNEVATVQLLLGPEVCADCILPRPSLEAVLRVAIARRHPSVSKVHLIDPRETTPAL